MTAIETQPVIERIALTIINRLERIAVENGYSFNVASVKRLDRLGEGIQFEHQSIVVRHVGTTEYPSMSYPGNPPSIGQQSVFHVHCMIRESDREQAPYEVTANEFAACIRKAITTPEESPSTWYHLDGHSIDTDIGGYTPYSPTPGTVAGISIVITAYYRISEINAYTLRA